MRVRVVGGEVAESAQRGDEQQQEGERQPVELLRLGLDLNPHELTQLEGFPPKLLRLTCTALTWCLVARACKALPRGRGSGGNRAAFEGSRRTAILL